MVVGVSVKKENEARLKALGLKDSKELTPKKREVLAKKIEEIAEDIIVMKVSACRIDGMRKEGTNLNRIEEMKFLDILNLLNPSLAYIDSPDVKPERLKKVLGKDLGGELVVEHKADSKYPVVSAASIIAKVERDREVAEFKKEFGDFGPGYPSNEVTMAWMRKWFARKKGWPEIVRKSWATTKEVEREASQTRLGLFKKFKRDDDC